MIFLLTTEAIVVNHSAIEKNSRELHRLGILFEGFAHKQDMMLELLDAHVTEKPTQKKIGATLENHENRIRVLEVKVQDN